MRRIMLIAVVVMTPLLASCGAGRQETTTVQPAAAATSMAPTPTPTPTALTREQAARRYLQIVGPHNTSVAKVNAIAHQHRTKSRSATVPASYRKAAADASTQSRAFMAGLLSTPWPVDVAATAGRIADDVSGEVSAYLSLADAKTWGDVEDTWASVPATSNASAQKIRVQLGLPPAK